MAVSKTWSYTLNNYCDLDVEFFKRLECTRHRCNKEIGDSGTDHLQGTITFKSATRLAALKKLHPRAHWEPTKAIEASLNYCGKVDGECIIDVNNSKQGRRTDLEDAIKDLEQGGMSAVATNHPTAYVKFKRGLEALEAQWAAPQTQPPVKQFIRDFPTEVHVLWGPVGSGKSRKAREIDPDLYSVPEPVNGCIWFDGYRGEKTILFDDFYGWVKYHTLLQYLDRYPLQVPVKGGFARRNWTQVIITSNRLPEEWYGSRSEWDALNRRITSISKIE